MTFLGIEAYNSSNMGIESIDKQNERLDELLVAALCERDAPAFRMIIDIRKSMEPTDEPNLTYGELIKALGVTADDKGCVNGIALFNACIGVFDNKRIMGLPDKERLRVIRSAEGAISNRLGAMP